MGNGDWGLGIEPNPQSPFPIPLSQMAKMESNYSPVRCQRYSKSSMKTIDKLNINNDSIECVIEDTSKEIDYSLYFHSPLDIDNFPYKLAIENDRRNFFEIFMKIFKNKYIFLRAYYTRSKYELVLVNYSFIVFHYSIIGIVAVAVDNERMILKKYHNNGYVVFNYSLLRAFYSFIVGYFVYKVESSINYTMIIDAFVKEIKIQFLLIIKKEIGSFWNSCFLVKIYHLDRVWDCYDLYYK